LGVLPGFFALSGFLMAALYLRQEPSMFSVATFARARFARIYPLFALAIIGSAFVYHIDQTFPLRLTSVRRLSIAIAKSHYIKTIKFGIFFDVDRPEAHANRI
jgi:peptidoglycan/LPS O-acetylase OafA/YrhL